MLTPSYFTTNQSEERPCTEHTFFEPSLHSISLPTPGWDTQLFGQESTVSPFVWPNSKAALFYFTQKSVSEI